jgi:hypothetical protein
VHRSAGWRHDWEVGYVGGSVVYVQPEMMKCNSTTNCTPSSHTQLHQRGTTVGSIHGGCVG